MIQLTDNMSITKSEAKLGSEYRPGSASVQDTVTVPDKEDTNLYSLKTLAYLAYVKHIGYTGPTFGPNLPMWVHN